MNIQETQLFARDHFRPEISDNIKSILTFGGSTTWGTAVGGDGLLTGGVLPVNFTWPKKLENEIIKNNLNFKVFNFGVVGSNTECSYKTFEYFIGRIKNSSIVIFHNGYNDLPIIFNFKDNKFNILNTKKKSSFCMYDNFFVPKVYLFKRTLINNFPVIGKFSKKLVTGSNNIIFGFEVLESDQTLQLTEQELYAYIYLNTIAHINKLNSYTLANPNISFLNIIEPEIVNFTPNGSSFGNLNIYLDIYTRLHIYQQNIIKNNMPKNVKTLDLSNDFKNNSYLYYYDEIHMNSMGNSIVAKKVFEKLFN